MKIYILTLAMVVLFPVFSYAQGGYVGYRYKGVSPSNKLPNGVTHLGGGMIGDINAATVHGVSQVQRGRTKMLWLEASTGQDSGGVTGWKVLDVVSFPRITNADHLLIPGDPAVMCRRGGKEIVNLAGVGRINMRRGVFTPSQLWVANIKTGRFVPQNLRGVKCEFSAP